MGSFVNELQEFTLKIGNKRIKKGRELNPDVTTHFMELNNKCNELEDVRIKSRILPNYNMSAFESISNLIKKI